jgi:hypothetical protein
METDENKLKKILEHETTRIRSSYKGDEVIFGLIEIIRSIDYQSFILGPNLRKGDINLLEKYKFGWALPFKLLYEELSLGEVPLFPSFRDSYEWADSTIQHSGSIQVCYQLLDYKKAGLMELNSYDEKKFMFSNLTEYPVEYYEKISLDYYYSIVNNIFEERAKAMIEKLPSMRKNLESIVNLMYDEFISYRATDEIDLFYSEFAYLYIMTTQAVEEFDEKDIFGGYSYKDFLDVAEYICKSGIMHRDCCMALAEKTSHKVNLRNILSYGFSVNSFIDSLSNYLGWEKNKVREIISCFALTKENYLHHLSYPKASASPYFALGKDIWIRSTFGCLDRPIFFLNRELKRKYPKDYFNAVNNREIRFKEQLYSFFNQERIVRVQKNVNIKNDNDATDIDAVIFDKERNILGLFQLKWQDTFYTSMRERFSRITNLVPKSVEWIDKVNNWLKSNDSKTILKTLKINNTSDKIENVYLFVISRNHVHFTNQKLDDRAFWAYWYQVIEASAKVKDPLNTNPIAEFAAKLKFFSPSFRKDIDKNENSQDYSFRFADYTILVKANKQ